MFVAVLPKAEKMPDVECVLFFILFSKLSYPSRGQGGIIIHFYASELCLTKLVNAYSVCTCGTGKEV